MEIFVVELKLGGGSWSFWGGWSSWCWSGWGSYSSCSRFWHCWTGTIGFGFGIKSFLGFLWKSSFFLESFSQFWWSLNSSGGFSSFFWFGFFFSLGLSSNLGISLLEGFIFGTFTFELVLFGFSFSLDSCICLHDVGKSINSC
jgi:hypothetical protein